MRQWRSQAAMLMTHSTRSLARLQRLRWRDAMLVLKRARCSQNAELHITGRDIEESRKALRFDTESMKWEHLGEANQVWKSQQRTDIIDLLRKENMSMQPGEIADALNKSSAAVRKTLSRMIRMNQILWFKGGLYDSKNEDRDPSDPRYLTLPFSGSGIE